MPIEAVKSIRLFVRHVYAFLYWYESKAFLRVLLVLGLWILSWWACGLETTKLRISALVLIIFIEYMTINVMFDRDFYPADIIVDPLIPDRKSKQHIAAYVVFYLLFMLGAMVGVYYLCLEAA